jgi:hypothetical protein
MRSTSFRKSATVLSLISVISLIAVACGGSNSKSTTLFPNDGSAECTTSTARQTEVGVSGPRPVPSLVTVGVASGRLSARFDLPVGFIAYPAYESVYLTVTLKSTESETKYSLQWISPDDSPAGAPGTVRNDQGQPWKGFADLVWPRSAAHPIPIETVIDFNRTTAPMSVLMSVATSDLDELGSTFEWSALIHSVHIRGTEVGSSKSSCGDDVEGTGPLNEFPSSTTVRSGTDEATTTTAKGSGSRAPQSLIPMRALSKADAGKVCASLFGTTVAWPALKDPSRITQGAGYGGQWIGWLKVGPDNDLLIADPTSTWSGTPMDNSSTVYYVLRIGNPILQAIDGPTSWRPSNSEIIRTTETLPSQLAISTDSSGTVNGCEVFQAYEYP